MTNPAPPDEDLAAKAAKLRTPEICPACFREIPKANLGGARPHNKLRRRHKCPHGQWCGQGDRTWGSHSNGRARCPDCRDLGLAVQYWIATHPRDSP